MVRTFAEFWQRLTEGKLDKCQRFGEAAKKLNNIMALPRGVEPLFSG
jgi:hypothetical protein